MSVVKAVVALDLGTSSVRAAVFNLSTGNPLSADDAVVPIPTWIAPPSFVVQHSGATWLACQTAIRRAVSNAAVNADLDVVGVGVDATCSLVLRGGDDAQRPIRAMPEGVTVRPPALPADCPDQDFGDDGWDTIVWMDHRAEAEAKDMNASTDAAVTAPLRGVGGRISPEMQPPKLLWMSRHMPAGFSCVTHAFDLADFITFRLTGSMQRSICTATCKWLLQSQQDGWPKAFYAAFGIDSLVRGAGDHIAPAGSEFLMLGSPVGSGIHASAGLSPALPVGCAVSVGVIDAHAGGIACASAGTALSQEHGGDSTLTMALIAGTSSCHMFSAPSPCFVPGVWGPYRNAMLPGLYLNEAGQSASGAVIEAVVSRGFACLKQHAGVQKEEKEAFGPQIECLQQRLQRLVQTAASIESEAPWQSAAGALTRHVHMGVDWIGNRSPLAESSLRGTHVGLGLQFDLDELARQYLATVQALAYGTRQIVEAVCQASHGTTAVQSVVATGGLAQDALFLQQHADVLGCPVAALKGNGMLAGSAALAASAAVWTGAIRSPLESLSPTSEGDRRALILHFGRLFARTDHMTTAQPTRSERLIQFHHSKYAVSLAMQSDQLRYRSLMEGVS